MLPAGVGADADGRESAALAPIVASYLGELQTRATPATIRNARRSLDRFVRELHGCSANDVRAWRIERLKAGASNKTVNTDVGYLKAALALAFESGLLDSHPLARLRSLPITARFQRRRPRALTDEECRRLLEESESADRQWPYPRTPFIAALLLTGARYGELAKAVWADFDSGRATLRIRGENSKTQVERVIPLDPTLMQRIDGARFAHQQATGMIPGPSSRLFLTPRGCPLPDDSGAFLRQLKGLYKRAGIELRDGLGRVVHTHALRHTAATRLARAGVPLLVTQRVLGHASGQMLAKVYAHLEAEDARDAINHLPRLF